MDNEIRHAGIADEDTIRNEKKLTIRNIVITVLVIVFFAGIILMYYGMLYKETRDNIIKTGEMTAKESADHIDQYLSTNIDSIKLAAYTLDEMITEGRSDADIQDYLVGQSTALKNAVIGNSAGLYGYINGRFFSGTNWVPPEGYVATERPWYTRPMEYPGIITIMDPYVDAQSGNVMIALGKTLCDGVSVISVDVSLDEIQKRTEDAVTSGNSDIEMLVNESGVVVAHSEITEIGKNYNEEKGTLGAEIVGSLKEAGDYYFDLDYEGLNYIVYVAEIQNGWVCISAKDSTLVFDSLNTILFITISVVIAIILIMSIIMTRSNKYLHMSARALAANEAKTAFLSNMSHEIRTPINAILGMNELILRESRDKNIISYSENVKNAGKSLLGLVNDILDFSKIEAGKIEINAVDYDLSVMINDLINMIDGRIQYKGLILEENINREIPRYLHGDDVRIRQVISNLLTNAVKYTERGIIFFGMGFNRCDDDPNSIELIVSVKDTGIGIREDDMQKLFSQFERIEEKRNRNIEGTGLGLNITKNLLEMMGSEIKVESEYGKGSTFRFNLRQKVTSWEQLGDYKSYVRESAEGRKQYREKFIAPDARVLVVDDNLMNLTVFKSLVKKTKVKVDTAGSGNDGILLTLNNTYDIIFMDHMMPHKDGIETLHDIRGNEENTNCKKPVICLTANAVSGAKEKYLAEGFDDYLSKPVDPDKLEDMMLKYLPRELVRMGVGDEAEDEEDEKLSEILAPLEGSPIDTKEGLKNSGSVDAYIELLKIYHDSVPEKTEEINGYYKENDIKNYTIKVHALKSSSKIIGAKSFGEKAQQLEDAGKRNDTDYIHTHHELFMKEYQSYGDLLSVLFNKTEECNKTEIDREFLKTIFDEIKSAAEDMDCDRLESIFAEADNYSIPGEDEALYKKLKAASNQYDYDSILAILSQG